MAKAIRWANVTSKGTPWSRIAAFYNHGVAAASDGQPTEEVVAFFESIGSQDVARLLLFDAKGSPQRMEAMDGPINFGDRDQWWGLLVKKGFEFTPLYANHTISRSLY